MKLKSVNLLKLILKEKNSNDTNHQNAASDDS